MSFGSLSVLPVKASDFASACFTADVPRKYLRLVLVRILAMGAAAAVDTARCRTAAFLFDSRLDVPAFCDAARAAVRATRTTTAAEPDDLCIANVHLYRRMTGIVVTVDEETPGSDSVYVESVVPAGRLRGTLNVDSGALPAYLAHATVRAQVCVVTAAAALAHHRGGGCPQTPAGGGCPQTPAGGGCPQTPAGGSCPQTPASARRAGGVGAAAAPTAIVDRYVAGLMRLGVDRPTQRIPDGAVCSGTADCSCFMARAVWRGGRAWMLVYAVLPPPTDSSVPLPPSRPAPAWLARLMDVPPAPNILADFVPSTWTVSTRALAHAFSVPGAAVLLAAATDADDASSASATTEDDESSEPLLFDANESLAAIACRWALARPEFASQLAGIAPMLGLYYKSALEHVLLTRRRREFVARTLMAAARVGSMSAGGAGAAARDDIVLASLTTSPHAHAAIVRLMGAFSGTGTLWRPRHVAGATSAGGTALLRSSTSTGYALVVACAIICMCHAHVQLPRPVNTWDAYVTISAPIAPAVYNFVGETMRD